jgi:pyrroline-5-carboxylate reductase
MPSASSNASSRVWLQRDPSAKSPQFPTSYKVGFIGLGNMGQAILKGIIENKAVSNPKTDILFHSTTKANMERNAEKFGICPKDSNEEVVLGSDIIFLCVKPGMYAGIGEELKSVVRYDDKRKLLVSVMAGVAVEVRRENIKYEEYNRFNGLHTIL